MTYLSRCALLTILVSPFSLANNVVVELSICAKNEDSLQRLACYDKLAKKSVHNQSDKPITQLPTAQNTVTTEALKSENNSLPAIKDVHSDNVSVARKQSKPAKMSKPKTLVNVDTTQSNQQEANFGHENQQSKKELINQIQASIVKVIKSPRGEQIITLDNGQVWRQTDSNSFTLKKDQLVYVERGVFGSFFIGRENSNRRIRVKRVK